MCSDKDAEIKRIQARLADTEEVLEDKRRLTRELDVALNGEEGAAKQAALCDLIPQAEILHSRLEKAEGLLRKRSRFYGDEGQLFNKMVEEWKEEGCWSDWDETIYQTRMQIEKEIYDFLTPTPAGEKIDFSCSICGAEVIIAPNPPRKAVCPKHCPDHIYTYIKGEGCHRCDNCGQEPPDDWRFGPYWEITFVPGADTCFVAAAIQRMKLRL